MANETTIQVRTAVTGLDQLEKANSMIEKLKASAKGLGSMSGGDSGFSKMTAQIEKATLNADKLKVSLKSAMEAGGGHDSGITSMQEGLSKSTSSAEKLNKALHESASASKGFSESQSRTVDYNERAAASAQKMAESHKAINQMGNTNMNSASRFAESSAKAEGSWGKIKGSIKDALSMFSVGMMGAAAVSAVGTGIKKAVNLGYEGIKERQSGQAMWATSVADAHPNVSGKQLRNQSAKANMAMLSTAIKAGNSFNEANSMAKQVYSSSAGSYSGNLKKTQSLVSGMFNIQDANQLNQMDMNRFKMSVGNIGDLGKMNGGIAKSLNLLDGKIGQHIREEYTKETGKQLAKTKSGNWDWGQVNAQTAYAGIDEYGHSRGVGHASERANATLGGMTRAGGEFVKQAMTNFEQKFAGNIGKAFGGKGGIITKMSKYFTNDKNFQNLGDAAGNKLSAFAVQIGKVAKAVAGAGKAIAPYVATFSSGFAKGFIGEIKTVGTGIKATYDKIKGLGKSASKIIPPKALSSIGQITGKVSAFLLALRGFGKLPGMAGVVSKIVTPLTSMLSKLPIVGKTISNIISKITGTNSPQMSAGQTMMSAANTMQAAADKMLGGGTGAGGAALNPDGSVMTREELRNGGKKMPWYTRFSQEGDELLNNGAHAADRGTWMSRLKGNTLSKLGGWGESFANSKAGGLLSSIGSGIGKTGSFLEKGNGALNALFAGVDVANTMSKTKAGSLSRHKGVGADIGNGVGATLGGAALSGLGPAGMIAGSMAGGWLGGKAGSWIGGLFGGSKPKKRGKSAAQMAAEAYQHAQIDSQAASVVSLGGAANTAQAKAQYRSIQKATQSKSKGAQRHAANASLDYENGDMAKYQAETKAAAKDTAVYYRKQAKAKKSEVASAERAAARAKSSYRKREKDNPGAVVDDSKVKAANKRLSSARKAARSASGKASQADKDSIALGNKSASSTKKATEATKKHTAAVKKDGAASKKAASDRDKADSKSTKGFSKLTKSQKKELAKQTKNLKSENAKQARQIKSANAKVKQAQSRAAKDISKADKAASKAMSKNYKTASKQISKAVKSGMSKAASAAKTGSNKISKNIKSGLKNVGKVGKTSFKGLTNGVKSGMKGAERAAKSGAKRIGTALKSGLKSASRVSKSSLKGVTTAVKSALSKATSAAKSGANKIGSALKSGFSKAASAVKSSMSKVNSAMSSAMSKLQSTANRATSSVAKSFSKIGAAATAAVGKIKALASAMNSLKSKTITLKVNVSGKGASKLSTGTPGAKAPWHLAGGWSPNGGTQAGIYTVNDGHGGHWQEGFRLSNGLMGLFPKKRDFKAHLPAGTQVFNGDDTHRLFKHLKAGTPGAKSSKPHERSKAPVINITVNVTGDTGGGSRGSVSTKLANQIANAIGEKFLKIFPTNAI
ncbi:hypothetical protein [Lacticaseibacillus zhaodongensis]|uniref:hypothetical protein n=1 Tax=Lacticaseibacillus zhaodongensis TaxID=2668065 RepID=UPI0012D363A9|nr:hypothetical protein [Lacticaseibacillus zhaodongensis]